ncbi:MAG: hypothetical protein LBI33_07215 [Propionibacteriaceae bacterium]|nr:hypothetical protein [Propionibacteriaceae bacterium]
MTRIVQGEQVQAKPGLLVVSMRSDVGPDGRAYWTFQAIDLYCGWVSTASAQCPAEVMPAVVRMVGSFPFDVTLLEINADPHLSPNPVTQAAEAAGVSIRYVAVASSPLVMDGVPRLPHNARYDHVIMDELWRYRGERRNHFVPTTRFTGLELRGDGTSRRSHDLPRTPFEPLLDPGVITVCQQAALREHHRTLDPVDLTRHIEDLESRLFGKESFA